MSMQMKNILFQYLANVHFLVFGTRERLSNVIRKVLPWMMN